MCVKYTHTALVVVVSGGEYENEQIEVRTNNVQSSYVRRRQTSRASNANDEESSRAATSRICSQSSIKKELVPIPIDGGGGGGWW